MTPDQPPPVAALPLHTSPAPRPRWGHAFLTLLTVLLGGVVVAVAVTREHPASTPVPVAEEGIAEDVAGAAERVVVTPAADEIERQREARRVALVEAKATIDDANRIIFALGKKHAPEVFRTSARVLDWHADLRHRSDPEDAPFELSFGECVPMFPRGLHRRGTWPTRNELAVALMQMRVVRAMPEAERRAVDEAFERRDKAEALIRTPPQHLRGVGMGIADWDAPDGLGAPSRRPGAR